MYFKNLQVLRGLASIAVVLYHVRHYMGALGQNERTIFRIFDERFSYGAWFFFTLSGFLMAYLIDTGYQRFLPHRLLRIYPTFLLAVVAVIFGKVVIFGSVSNQHLLKAMSLLPFGRGVGARETYFPLGIEWTLIFEVFFYFVCSLFALNLTRRFFLPFLFVWLAAIVVTARFYGVREAIMPNFAEIAISPYNILFIAGSFSYYVFRRTQTLSRRVAGPCLAVAVVAFLCADPARDAVLAVWTHRPPAGGPVNLLLSGNFIFIAQLLCLSLAFALVVYVMAVFDRGRPHTLKESVGEKLGDYSYALYLIHVPVISILLAAYNWVSHKAVAPWYIGAVALAASLTVGWYFGKVDLLLHRYFKGLLRPRSRHPEVAPAAVTAPLTTPALESSSLPR